MENTTESYCKTTRAWEHLEEERLMGFRVFTRGIWYALTIFSCFGLLIYGKQVLFSPIRFGVTTFFAVMLLRCLFFVENPSPTDGVLKHIRFVTSLIILPFMFYVPFYYPTTEVLVTIFSLLAGGVSIYQLSWTMDIGHGLLLLFGALVPLLCCMSPGGQDSNLHQVLHICIHVSPHQRRGCLVEKHIAHFTHIEAFPRSSFQVGAMIFFFLCDEPLKSITSAYIPTICIASYVHLLILLAILRLKNNFGVCDRLLAASFALLYPLATTWLAKLALFIGGVIFTGLKNLQFREIANPSPNPNPAIP
ncbi:unnamed protein product [Microthlaspi erraticum]|uniref:Transmembrane protein n=1 Tax=Microthlaspi erraticum TaxID=1685480 RepID=A0A6D2IRS4_9BRAS|nr:unnamed protein product [Microthlaspi erraticum]